MRTSAGKEPKQVDAKGQTPRGKDSLRLRLASAAIGLPLLLVLILAGPAFTLALVAAATLLGLWELYRLAGVQHLWRQRLPGFVLGLALIAGGWYAQANLLAALAALSPIAILLAHRWIPQALRPWLMMVAGPLYLGATLAHGVLLRGWTSGAQMQLYGHHFPLPLPDVLLRRLDMGSELLLLALLSTFAVDTAAFFVGRTIGRHRLDSRISPGKTWEGAIGGLAGGIAATTGLMLLFGLPLALWEAMLLGGILGIVGQAGDLMESAIKRAHQAKDAGGLIPGHGGILDRLDSVVYNLVVVYHFSSWGIV
ncbi:MAG: phosphatidate cytidylyltransferase [Chloroflexi bacterium]|nr:phosphatidate cytidylyltransferase [Chloroflexota bacterium]